MKKKISLVSRPAFAVLCMFSAGFLVSGALFVNVALLYNCVSLQQQQERQQHMQQQQEQRQHGQPAPQEPSSSTTTVSTKPNATTCSIASTLDRNSVEIFELFALNPPVPRDVPYPDRIQRQTHFSQVGQDEAIDAILKQKRNGFFIEVGAYDGVSMSNSLFFEKSRNWTGLLIEANPRAYRELLAADRKSFSTPACISKSSTVELGVNFQSDGMIGGYNLNKMQQREFQMDSKRNPFVYSVKANCFPLNTMLDAIGVDRVDMFSLDVEGAELAVLKSIDWARVSIGLLMIETNEQDEAIHEFLVPRGYQKVDSVQGVDKPKWHVSDAMYVLKSEFPPHAVMG
mmetsp:Transcript_15083/g.32959  ORF Transcript_15083/g.32959 Transcript_15083/m.32959 type:complete len:343 (+) Transcript_15083:52-1080(+)